MTNVYITQFEMTRAFSTARKAIESELREGNYAHVWVNDELKSFEMIPENVSFLITELNAGRSFYIAASWDSLDQTKVQKLQVE